MRVLAEGVNEGEELLARPVKPFGGGRPWLRRTGALCKFNCGEGRVWGWPKLRRGTLAGTPGTQKMATGERGCENCCGGGGRKKFVFWPARVERRDRKLAG